MKRQIRHPTLIILVGLLLLCICVFLLQGFLLHQEELDSLRENTASSPVFGLDPASIVCISYTRDAQFFSFSLHPDGLWVYDLDPEYSVSQDFMRSLVLLLGYIEPILVVPEEDAIPSHFDLDRPPVQVEVTLSNGNTCGFSIGMRNPYTLDYYIMPDDGSGDIVLVDYSVGKSFFYSLEEIAETST